MLKFLNNREIAEKLDINLAKWKRWSREFLPPDPLGGLQSGYARQYHPDQAFTVYLGGVLVSDLKYSIPEARRIMADLHPYWVETGYLFHVKTGLKPAAKAAAPSMGTQLIIEQYQDFSFRYILRTTWSLKRISGGDPPIVEKRCTETEIQGGSILAPARRALAARLLDITQLLARFAETLGIDPAHYPALHGNGKEAAPD